MFHHISELSPAHLAIHDRYANPTATDACWLWTGPTDRYGYGDVRARWNGQRTHTGAHRVAYLIHHTEIPQGLVIDHLCRQRSCVNPGHLEAVTNAVNLGRGRPQNQMHCINGHPFTPENVYLNKNGHRICRECSRRHARAWKAKSRATC